MRVEVYGKSWCSYCDRAKDLLASREQDYEFYDVEEDTSKYDEMMVKNPSTKTVPQIFIDGEHIGGYDQLREWYKGR